MMARYPDWQTRLTCYLADCARAPFRPGHHDCMLFVAGAVLAMTGVDLARGWRGYRTLSEGQRSLRRKGYADHVSLVRTLLPEIIRPRPGDVAVIQTPDGPGVGIVQGQAIYAVAAVGWTLVPMTDAIAFFEVI